MIKLVHIEPASDFQLRLRFSDGRRGVFEGRTLLQRAGPFGTSQDSCRLIHATNRPMSSA